jgi:FMN reductase
VTADAATAVGISGSPSRQSRSRSLLEHALGRLRERGVETTLIDLAELPADALLGRRSDTEVQRALTLVEHATIVIASTPVYRATYTGLLKVFFDLFPQRALAGKVAIAIATGAAREHRIVIDDGLRPLFASVNAEIAPGIYARDAEMADPEQRALVLQQIDRAISEALTLLDRDAPQDTPQPSS